MVRFTIPSVSAALLAMSIGAFGSDEAAHGPKLRRNGKDSEVANLRKSIKKTVEPVYQPITVLKGSDAAQLGVSAAEEKKGKKKGKKGKLPFKGKNKKGKNFKKGKKGFSSDIYGGYAVVLREGTFQGFGNGLLYYDGEGNISGDMTFNTPGEQSHFTTAVTGTYDLEDDEMGARLQSWTYETTPNGPVTLQAALSLRSVDGQTGLATAVDGALTMPSQFYPNAYVSFTMFQRPKTGFSNANVAGIWNVVGFSSGIGPLGRAETGAVGRITLTEDGTFAGFLTVNDLGGIFDDLQGPVAPDGNTRTLFPSEVSGTWAINDDGTGDWVLENDTWIAQNVPIILLNHVVITEEWKGHAKTIKAFADEGGPITGPDAPFEWTFTRLDYAGAEYDSEEAEY